MRRTSAGFAAAHRPWTKKVARTFDAERASSIRPGLAGEAGWSGCSVSMVRATRMLLTGRHLTGEGELAWGQPTSAGEPPGQELGGHGRGRRRQAAAERAER